MKATTSPAMAALPRWRSASPFLSVDDEAEAPGAWDAPAVVCAELAPRVAVGPIELVSFVQEVMFSWKMPGTSSTCEVLKDGAEFEVVVAGVEVVGAAMGMDVDVEVGVDVGVDVGVAHVEEVGGALVSMSELELPSDKVEAL